MIQLENIPRSVANFYGETGIGDTEKDSGKQEKECEEPLCHVTE
jgi:hypothetical protein